MATIHFVSLLIMSAFYCFAGISHFRTPNFFLKITPKWVPYPEKINIVVGGIELTLGIALLFSSTRSYAAMGIIALLVVVFPANIYHFQQAKRKGRHVITTMIRLPVQALLIYWRILLFKLGYKHTFHFKLINQSASVSFMKN